MKKIIGGETIIGQGTHGIIKIDDENPNYVYKEFKEINNISFCSKLHNEYEIQSKLHRTLSDESIYILDCCCYTKAEQKCYYKMERIKPFPDTNKYYVINMYINDINKRFSHSTSAYEVGINMLNTLNINIGELVHNIGKLFSKMHYVLNLDGYDCELLYGIINDNAKFCLIDFDKIASFNWELGYKTYRKLDEDTITEKTLSNINKFAWYLFGAMISMSLIPSEPEYKNIFINGYLTHVNIENELQKKVYDEIVGLINDY